MWYPHLHLHSHSSILSAWAVGSSCLWMGITMKLIKRSHTVLSNIYTPISALLSNDYCLSLMKSQQTPRYYFDVSQVLSISSTLSLFHSLSVCLSFCVFFRLSFCFLFPSLFSFIYVPYLWSLSLFSLLSLEHAAPSLFVFLCHFPWWSASQKDERH